jgi:hypothetical protein
MIHLERTIFEPRVPIPRKDALRLAGLRATHREPRPSVMRIFEEELSSAERLVAPKAVMIFHAGGLVESSHFAPAVPLIAAVCTIGGALEARVQSLTTEGQMARAMILDAVGSAAVEALANHCNHLICERLDAPASHAGGRRSPGYGDLALEAQERIFALLRPSDIGVRLTPAFMMTPRKSVSFLMPLSTQPAESQGAIRCRRCGMTDCTYREKVPPS